MTAAPPPPDPWRCAWCGTHYPVPVLARDCETRHLTASPEESS